MGVRGTALPPLDSCCSSLPFSRSICVDVSLLLQFCQCAVESCSEAAILVHYKHSVFAFLTCFIFASHLPERLAPGHFDYIGKRQRCELGLLSP